MRVLSRRVRCSLRKGYGYLEIHPPKWSIAVRQTSPSGPAPEVGQASLRFFRPRELGARRRSTSHGRAPSAAARCCILSPPFNPISGVVYREEPGGIPALGPQARIERLDRRMIRGFTGSRAVECAHSVCTTPGHTGGGLLPALVFFRQLI